MSQSNTIAADLLVRMNQSVLALPKKPPKTQTEAMEYMSPAFKKAMKRGYSLEEIQAHIQEEFGLTLQMSKMKRSVLPNENAQVDTPAKPKKTKKPKQTDTPPQSDQNANATPVPKDQPKNEFLSTGKTEEKPAAPTNEKVEPAITPVAETPVLHKERINLSCKKEDQDLAKKLGAQWDNDKNLCYIPPLTDLRPFEKLLPKPLTSYGTQS